MDKILVNIYSPVVGASFDIFVPDYVEIGVLCGIIAKSIQELCSGEYLSSGKERLILREPEMLLETYKTFGDYGITDGTRLVIL